MSATKTTSANVAEEQKDDAIEALFGESVESFTEFTTEQGTFSSDISSIDDESFLENEEQAFI